MQDSDKGQHSVIEGILLEEKERNLIMQQQYLDEIAKLPKGSIIKKSRKSGDYHYLSFRDGKKVISVYLGKDTGHIEKVRRDIEKRKYLERLVKRLKDELKIIQRTVK